MRRGALLLIFDHAVEINNCLWMVCMCCCVGMRVHTVCALQGSWQHYCLRDMLKDPEACDSVCMCMRQCIRGSFDSCHNSCSSPAPGLGGPLLPPPPCLPPPSAPAGSWDSSQSQGVSVFIQPPLLPPLIQLFVSLFFKLALGDLCADAASPAWQAGGGKPLESICRVLPHQQPPPAIKSSHAGISPYPPCSIPSISTLIEMN